ncbi:sigma factor G inhibitor Gin [Paludifilum halophilum]|uniref:Inhibitor of sigma-G Gin n=1 Tax=Paludifilum halophilum TaxID=1642702 RepID=A0A235B2C4_9BACL|nr:sigma factor G inhibitor Gin [Paludifilum halophilum]OYD06392.1 inhibitor of sigma-G Gin [Paludifilum halophilum]
MQDTRDRIRCIVCEEERVKGIRVLDEFICETCEKEIVNTEVEDQKYPHFVLQLRNIWLNSQRRGL